MSDLLDRLQDMVIFKHDDMSVARKAIDYIEAQAARIAKLEAVLKEIKFMTTEAGGAERAEALIDEVLAGGKDD